MKKATLTLLFNFILLFSFGQLANPYWQIYNSKKLVWDISFLGDTAWVTTEGGGISTLASGTGLIENYNTLNSEIYTNCPRRIACSTTHGLWLTTYRRGELVHVKDYAMTDPSKWETFPYVVDYYGMVVNRNDEVFFIGIDTSAGVNSNSLYKYNGTSFSPIDSLYGINLVGSGQQILTDFDKNVWIYSNKCIFKEDSTGFHFVDSTLANSGYQSPIDIAPDSTVWTMLQSPVRFANLTSSGWVYYDSTYFGVDSLTSAVLLKCDKDGSIWGYAYRQNNTRFLIQYDGTNWNVYDSISAPPLNDGIINVSTSPNGNLWFCTFNGIYEYDGTNWMHHEAGVSAFQRSYIKKVAFDKNDDAWILGFRNYLKSDTLFTNTNLYANDLAVDTNGFPWFTHGSNPHGDPTFYHFDGSVWQTSFPDFVDGNAIIAIDRNNVKWIAVDQYGLIKYTDSVETIYTPTNSPLSQNGYFILFCDSKGNVWIYSYYVLQKFDGTSWTTWNVPSAGFPLRNLSGLTEDMQGNVWAWESFASGPAIIAKYDGQIWTTFNPPAGFPGHDINSVAFDHSNNLWARFFDIGLGKYDGNSWTMITPDNSPYTSIYHGSMTFDRFDNLFLCDLYHGLTIFNPSGIQYSNPAPTTYRMSGQIFHDADSNAVFDLTEFGMNSQRLLLLPDSTIITTNSAGKYSQNLYAGDYEITVLPFSGWNVTTDSVAYHIHVDSTAVVVPDFGLNASPFHSAEINQTNGMLYCGSDAKIWINYSNTGSIVDSGQVILHFDTIANFYTSFPPANIVNDTTAVWNFTGLNPFETRTITTEIYMDYLPNLVLTTMSEVKLKEDTNVVASDMTTQSDSVMCDNDYFSAMINVLPFGSGSQHIVNVTDTLQYTIRFQNATHDTVSFLNIVDTLDQNFDLTSFRVIASSHSVNYLFNNNLLTFTFSGINLPDSAVDFSDSQGYVTFSVIPKNTTPHLTVVHNSAMVSYDYTEVIQTNDIFNTIYRNGIGIDELENDAILQIYPNPAKGFLMVDFTSELQKDFSLSISDLLGRKILSKELKSDKTSIDVSGLKNGFYIVYVTDKNKNIKATKRVVISN